MSYLNHVNDDTMSEYLQWVQDNDGGFEDGGDDDAAQVFLDEEEVQEANRLVERLDGSPSARWQAALELGELVIRATDLPDGESECKVNLPDGTEVRLYSNVETVYVYTLSSTVYDSSGNVLATANWNKEL